MWHVTIQLEVGLAPAYDHLHDVERQWTSLQYMTPQVLHLRDQIANERHPSILCLHGPTPAPRD
jgi:hypothetical protein